MLCGDRRENVLSLYFSRAITRLDYVLSKLSATAILTMTIRRAGRLPLALPATAGRQAASRIDRQHRRSRRDRLIGTLIALLLGCVGLVVSSFTGRKSIATAIIFIGYAVLEGFVRADRGGELGASQDVIVLLSPIRLINELSEKLFGVYDPMAFGIAVSSCRSTSPSRSASSCRYRDHGLALCPGRLRRRP